MAASRPGPTDAPLAPRCRECGYVLTGLGPESRCPECGRHFNLADPETFIRHPPFLAWRFWLPGLCLAAVLGLGTMAALIYGVGSWGWSVWISAPLAAGAVLGYRVRAKWSVLPFLALALVIALCVGMMSLNIAGVFCGLVLAGIALGPVIVGAALGGLLRYILKQTSFDQRSYLPVLAIAGTAIALGFLDRATSAPSVEVVVTERVIHASPDRVWDSIMFYEEVKHPPPLILRVGLVRPLYTRGESRRVGDIKVCAYNRGQISKRISEVTPPGVAGTPGRLAFDIVEQSIGYERDVRLLGGSFELEGAPGGGATLVRLTTSYVPLLRPRLGWRWGERWGVHALHGHVLEGMRLRAEGTG